MVANKKQKIEPFPADGRIILHRLLASLIGDTNLLNNVSHDLMAIDFPDSFAFERQVIEALYKHAEYEMPPTQERIAEHIAVVHNLNPENVAYQLDLITAQKPEGSITDSIVRQSYGGFILWWDSQRTIYGLQQALQIYTQPSPLTEVEKRRIVQDKLSTAIPGIAQSKNYLTLKEQFQAFKGDHQQHIALVHRGKDPFPLFPWTAFNEAIGPLMPGQPMLLQAHEGWGKTSVKDHIGEYMAYEGGYYVHDLTTETDINSYQQRWYARWFGVPTLLFKRRWYNLQRYDGTYQIPIVDFDNPFWERNLGEEKVLQKEVEINTAGGVFVRTECNGLSIDKILEESIAHQHRAERMGLPYVAIVDYLQRIAWAMGGNQIDTLTLIANKWKNFAQSQKIFSIMLSQETRQGDDIKGFGSRVAQMVFQSQISLVREKGTEGDPEPVYGQDGQELLNALGQPRVMAGRRKGARSGEKTHFEGLKANEAEGGKVSIWFEAPLFHPIDIDNLHNDALWGVRHYEELKGLEAFYQGPVG